MARAVLKDHAEDFDELSLIPSDNQRFEVELNDELIFSKLDLGRFPEKNEIEDTVKEKLA